MKTKWTVAAAMLALVLAGCGKADQKTEGTAPEKAPEAKAEGALTGEAAAPVAEIAKAAEPAGEPAGHECTGDHGAAPIEHPDETTATDPATGASITAVGGKLQGGDTVKVADLLARPDDFVGKTVRLEGNVSAMCHHRRGWFAVIDDGDRSGTVVRVVTAPGFLVPQGAIGKKVRTEGTVEVVEVAANTARHFAKDHQVGSEEEIGAEPVKSIVVKATGAEFM